MKRLRSILVTGILVLVPIMLTVELLRWLMGAIDDGVRNYFPNILLRFDFPGFGLLLAIVLIFAVGLVAQNLGGRWLAFSFDKLVRRVPVIGGIYGGIRKFLETILNPANDQFKGAVLVQFPRAGIYSIGFRTGTPDPKLQKIVDKRLVNIFVPCTPNPTSGFYLLVPEEELVPLDLTVQEAFKVVVSMGIVTSEKA